LTALLSLALSESQWWTAFQPRHRPRWSGTAFVSVAGSGGLARRL